MPLVGRVCEECPRSDAEVAGERFEEGYVDTLQPMRYMVCNVNGDPCGEPFATSAEAEQSRNDYPAGCDYRVRLVEITVRVIEL